MAKTGEARCIEYINHHLEEPLKDGSLEFRTWKSCADIRDIDIYHQVAQALQKGELTQGLGFGELFYRIRIPKHEGDRFGDIWDVTLVGENDEDFLRKYGKHYKVVDI